MHIHVYIYVCRYIYIYPFSHSVYIQNPIPKWSRRQTNWNSIWVLFKDGSGVEGGSVEARGVNQLQSYNKSSGKDAAESMVVEFGNGEPTIRSRLLGMFARHVGKWLAQIPQVREGPA